MTPKLEQKLFKKYPKIFRQKDLSMQETCMCWGIDCGDGWYWLLDQLCHTIQNYLKHNTHLKLPQLEATQVKEKYGGLRFYTNYSDRLIDGMIWLAESMSYHICESCGSTDNVRLTKGWIKARCADCMQKENTNATHSTRTT